MNPEDDPFASVRLGDKSNQVVSPMEEKKEDAFSSVRFKEAEGFPGLYEVGRHAARIGSRIAETIGGIPGDVESLIESGLIYGIEKLGKKLTPEKKEELKALRKFPTSTELKQKSKEITGGFTEPENEYEKTIDEYVETFSSLLGPMKFRKALGVALAGTLAKEGLKVSGVGEGTQEAGKLGTMLLSTLYNPKGAVKYSSMQYDKANALSKGASIQATTFEKNIKDLVTDLEKGVTTAEKNSVLKPANELLKKIKNGKIAVNDLTAAKRDINSIIGEPETLSGAKKLLNKLGKEVDLAIKPYESINPSFAKAYRPANEIFGAVMQGNKASRFIQKNLGAKSVLGTIAGEAVLGHPEAILPTLGIAAGVHASAKTVDFFKRLAKSPELQKFYGRAIKAAMNEDVAALRLYEGKIEEILNHQTLHSSNQ